MAQDLIFDHVHSGVVVLQGAGTIVDVNPAAQRLLGLQDHPWEGRAPEEVAPQLAMALHQLGSSDEGVQTRLPPSERWTHLQSAPVVDPSGQVLGQVVLLHDIHEHKTLSQERELLIAELEAALAEVRTLSGLLPTCSHCRKICDEEGHWHDMEEYVAERSEARFSHGICPDCMKSHYGLTPEDL